MKILNLFHRRKSSVNKSQCKIALGSCAKDTKYKTKRGDTLIEVTFAIGIFSAVSVISISLMNSGLQTAQANLELTMARNEIDAQADALRFIQNSYIADRSHTIKEDQQFRRLWLRLTGGGSTGSHYEKGLAYAPNKVTGFNKFASDATTTDDLCKVSFYRNNNGVTGANGATYNNAFVINTRNLDPENINGTIITSKNSEGVNFTSSPLYPRIIYGSSTSSSDENGRLYGSNETRINRVEGIWILSLQDEVRGSDAPEFYDFHIRTCWYSPNSYYPNTIATVIRLYNPDAVEGDFQTRSL